MAPAAPAEPRSKAGTLATLTAVVGLIGSLFGNYAQYRTLGAKKIELDQAADKLNNARVAKEHRDLAVQMQRVNLQNRLDQINEQMHQVENDSMSARTSLAYAHQPGDFALANAQIREAAATYAELTPRKKDVQDKLDALEASVAACPGN